MNLRGKLLAHSHHTTAATLIAGRMARRVAGDTDSQSAAVQARQSGKTAAQSEIA